MDVDKLILLIKTLGFPIVVAIWFLWKFQTFMETQISQQTTMIELLRRLVEIH